MSFSKFPDFQAFRTDQITDYLTYFSQLDAPYCDFSIDDVMIWHDYNNDLEACELNGNLILRYSSVLDHEETYYVLVGIHKVKDTVNQLLDFLEENNLRPLLHYITHQVAELLKKEGASAILIEEDPENRDYVYNVQDLLGLKGKPYENLRTRINYFTRENQDVGLRRLNLHNEKERSAVLDTIISWSNRPKTWHNDPDEWELNVIKRHLQLADQLPVHAYGMYVKGDLVNVNVFHLPPHKGWLICNHVKCDYSYKSIYGYAFYSLFQVAASMGIKWVNFEQDLGIEGLRQIKTLFRPAYFLERYTVSRDPGAKYQ